MKQQKEITITGETVLLNLPDNNAEIIITATITQYRPTNLYLSSFTEPEELGECDYILSGFIRFAPVSAYEEPLMIDLTQRQLEELEEYFELELVTMDAADELFASKMINRRNER